MQMDKATLIGKMHVAKLSVCEDYAYFVNGDIQRIALSDGCSSGIDSDNASRAWVKAALAAEDLSIAHIAKKRQSILAAESFEHDMATLMVADIKNDFVRMAMYGDGCFATMTKREGKTVIQLSIVEFSANMPEYPRYLVDPELSKRWQELSQQQQNEKTIESYMWTVGEGEPELVNKQIVSLSGGIFQVWDKNEIEGLFLLSDGIASFTDCSVPEMIKSIFSFKNLNGQFLARRVRAAKISEKHNEDDFTIVGAYWGDEHENDAI